MARSLRRKGLPNFTTFGVDGPHYPHYLVAVVAGAGSHPLRRRPAILGCHVPGRVTRCIEHPQSRQEDTRREHRIQRHHREGQRIPVDVAADGQRDECDQAQRDHRTGGSEQDRARGAAFLRRPARRRSDARGHPHHFRPVQRRHHPRAGRTVHPHRRPADR
ncbi:hypothetical protein G6F22_019852 [Rhizopus arrhizus]|nr:hypothetical protein G6F22_019852 [Rhizopus arrhizus]